MKFHSFRSFMRAYFTLTKRERRGNIILISILLIQVIYIYVTRNYKTDSLPPEIEIIALSPADSTSSLNNTPSQNDNDELSLNQPAISLQLFDPNSIGADQWRKMGISNSISVRIRKYINKGGRFRVKKDLLKIYGFKEKDYFRLEPFIQIEKTKRLGTPPKKKITRPVFRKIKLNQSNESELISLPLVGTTRASRIVKYRTLLGGFTGVSQLNEVYGIDSSVYEAIKDKVIIDTSFVNKININSIEVDSLWHPYLSRKTLKRIILYRNNHGIFLNIQSVCDAALLNDELCAKIAPYLDLE